MWNRPRPGKVAVMVDLSPSTRGATFRNRQAFDQRVNQLIPGQPFETFAFSDHNQTLDASDPLIDLSSQQTTFKPPPADAIVLFSDGQFSLPADAPPTYPVIDPVLNNTTDSAISQIRPIGQHVLATVKNGEPTRRLIWTGATPDPNQEQLATPGSSNQVRAAIPPGDLWPENDSLSLNVMPPQLRQKWWVGSSPPQGWRSFPASALPTNLEAYLQPAVIVLKNIPAEDISSVQQQRLVEYVHHFGGALIIVGGDHAFAAGGYDASLLETLSPLSSSPPLPAQRWLLLIDASGSMSGGPWQTELAAVSRLLPQLPPYDAITVGSFAKELSLWPTLNVPAGLFPSGPTNLGLALQQILISSDGSLPTQLFLMTDADTQLPNPNDLAAALSQKKIHLNLLATGNGNALALLQSIAAQTGGYSLQQFDSNKWVDSANQLLRTALPDHFHHTIIAIAPAPPDSVSEWNQTWLKPDAVALQQSGSTAMSARWQVGLGQVIAVAYPAESSRISSLANQIASPPKDPRYSVTFNSGSQLHVMVNAIDGQHYLNNRSLTIQIREAINPIPQTAPGKYEIDLPAPHTSQIVTVTEQSKVIDRFAVAGRYVTEFDAIGNNLENLKLLADQTAGMVIPPGPVHPIDFKWPVRKTPLWSEFAFGGFVLISAGMLLNKHHRKTGPSSHATA